MNRQRIISILIIMIMLIAVPLSAGIYRYTDENGVVRLTNISPSQKKRLTVKILTNKKSNIESSLDYDQHIQQAADYHAIPFSLIKAIIKAESNFDPQAVSSRGARGLMQLMPNNSRSLGIIDPEEPKANIMGGTSYFKSMLVQFDGNLILALAAYNAGPQVVGNYQGIPPYAETRDYVERVLKYYREYAAVAEKGEQMVNLVHWLPL